MTRWAMVIDLDRCTACQACVVSCQTENNIPPAGPAEAAHGRSIAWMRLVPMREEHGAAHTAMRLMPVLCMHCEKPPCMKVCPAGATRIDSEGLVGQNYARCIGCRYCTTACPYTVRQFNWTLPSWPQPMEQGLSPDVSVRPRGVVEKCSFCHHRLQRARDQARMDGRPLRDGDYVPACVESCPAEAMFFGDLDDPRSTVTRLSEGPRAFRLLDELGTKPKVIYLSKGESGGDI